MLPLPRGALWPLLFLFCAALYINGVRSEGRVVCYYTNWSVYRPGTAKFNPQNINPYLCTHLIYAFGGFTKDNQMKPFDKYQDIEQGGYAKFTGLKTYNKQLKTMIAIGGWNEASSRFSPLVANPERRQKFIKNILKFLRQNHFDGIDLDWEYPAHREGGKSRDRDNYAQLVQELRAEFEREAEKTGRPRLLVTMAVPAGIEYIEKGYDIPKLNKYLDWFNLLTYDFHSSHEPSVNHHAPLYSLEEESEYNYDAELNIDYSIKFYLNAGADKDKLVLGIPTYGRSFTLINEESTEIGAPAEAPGEQGDATREKGYLAYYEICQNLKEDPEWTVVQPNPNAMGPYAYRRTQWVGYDDEAIVRKKAQYVVDNGLGGIMFWAIDNDDFRGTCTGKPYPLIEAAKEAMLEALGLGINEVSKSSAPQKPSRSRSRENSSSTRNRITTGEQKLTYAERKGSSKRTQTTQQNTRNIQQSTTNAPVSIKLTEAEGSSLYIGGRTTTPPPPTTPDPGTDFKCEDEGFFQHPRDCKKYYWCLDSGPSGLGIVAHQFTCPSGLYFNPAADSCDFARNVPCKTKKSTTVAPITSYSTTTTTTPRPTQSVNRIQAATSRTSFFRTTSTTTTTEAPEEEVEYEEDDEDNAASPFAKHKGSIDKEAEEDPQVIKELIELIRKVGGVEELEKHLLRKDDGTISIKENSSSSSSSSITVTTASPISKSLYEKVLSKPNALNSFRNRFTSSNTFRNKQTKTEIKAQDETELQQESDKIDAKSSVATAGYSKYSSVVRGNSRQGPQNEGIEKSNEFDGLYKGKKQYTTINRGNKKASNAEEENEAIIAKSDRERDAEEEVEEVEVKTTKRPFSSNTPAYSTIRRTRPPTTTEADEDEEVSEEEKEVTDRKSYSSLNRSSARGTTTTEISDVTDVTAGSTRYKYLERSRPTRPTTEASNKLIDEDEDEELEDHENTVLLKDNENTRETQQEITTNTQRAYVSIGRRTTTATPETETTTIAAKATTTTTATPTTETPITTPLTNLETTTPESILITTSNSNIAITTTTNPTTISTTTTSTRATTLPNGKEVLDSLTTTPYPYEIDNDSDTLSLSLNINSIFTESTSTTSPPTTESGLDTTKQVNDILETTTTTEKTASTITEANDIAQKTEDLEVKQQETNDEVTLVNKLRNKTLYTTRTRTTPTRTTTTSSDIETTSSPSTTTTNNKNTFGVRRQQLLLNRSSQTKTTTTDISSPSTESVNNDFLGTVSSPRPFGFPKRRTRPTTGASVSTTTIDEIVKPNDESLVTKQKTSKLNAAVNTQTKVSSHNTILSQTASELDTETHSRREHAHKHNESEVTSTEHVNDNDIHVKHSKKHDVKQVVGFEGNTNNLLKHVSIVNSYNNDNFAHKTKTHTIVEEVDDDEDNVPHKLYSWRDARRPTKPTPKKKKLVVTEVTTEERIKQRGSPDHDTLVNVVENNDKDLRFNKKEENTGKFSGKYRGKRLETSLEEDVLHQDNQVDSEQTENEGRAFRTYTTINRRGNQNNQSETIGQDEVSLNDFKVTQVVRAGGEEADIEVTKSKHQYTSTNRGQSAQDSSSFKNGNVDEEVKYTNLNIGHNEKLFDDSDINNDQNNVSVNSEGTSLQTEFKYTTVTREKPIKAFIDDGTSSFEKSFENVEKNSTSKTSEENYGSQGSAKFKYTTVTRGQETNSDSESKSSTEISKETNVVNDHDHTLPSVTKTKIAGVESGKNNSIDANKKTDKLQYTSITREQDSQGTVGHDSENAEGNNDTEFTTKFKYTKVTRGQSSQEIVDDGSTNKTLNRTSDSQQDTDLETQENSRFGNPKQETEKRTYTTINRNKDSILATQESNDGSDTKENSNTIHTSKSENIPYKGIVRGSDGVHLTEGELSGFVKISGGSSINNNTKSEKIYQTISRGGQIDQSLNTKQKIEAMSLTHIEKEQIEGTESIDKAKDNEEEAKLTAEIEEGVNNSDKDFTTDDSLSTTEPSKDQAPATILTSTESTTTTTEEPLKLTEDKSLNFTEEITESTPEAVTKNILFRNRASTTSSTTTSPEPTTRISFRNRDSTTTTDATESTSKLTTTNEEAEVDASTRTTKLRDESTTQTPRRRTVLRRRISSVANAVTEEEITQTSEHIDSERTTKLATDNEEAKVEASTRRYLTRARTTTVYNETTTQTPRRRRPTFTANEAIEVKESHTLDHIDNKSQINSDSNADKTRTTSFRRRTVLRRKPMDNNLTKTHSTSLNSKLDNESKSMENSERSLSTSGAGLSKTEVVIQTLIQANDSSDNLKHNKTDKTLSDVEGIDFNTERRKNVFAINSSTENRFSHNLDTDKEVNKTESNNLYNTESEKEQNSVDNSISTSSRNSSNSQTQEISHSRGSFNTQKGDSETLTETTSTKTLSRGSYRPSEKGDISSLLALDLANKQGSQTLPGNGSRRKMIVKTSKTENQDVAAGRNNVNSFNLDQSSSTTESLGVNGGRKIIIKKRIQTNKTVGTKRTQELENNELEHNNSTSTDDVKLSKTDKNSKNSELTDESKSLQSAENSLDPSDDELSKNKVVTQTLAQDNDSSANLKHITSDQEKLGNVKSNSFNSQKHKNLYGTKSITENRFSHNTERDKDISDTESNSSYSTDSEKDQNSVDNSISSSSSSKFNSRNSLNLQTQENSRKTSLYNRRGSFNSRLQNNHGKTEEIETLEDGTTRIKTTHVEKINTGGNTLKTIKRTKTKTIVKPAPEYEYEAYDIPVSSTTRRPINRNRGSARFESSDLSSLLALDFASKSNRRVEGEITASKSRRKLIRKPDIVTETEHVEEYEEEIATRPPRPLTTTTAAEPIRRRTRPTRPLRTTTTTTKAPKTENFVEEVEEKVVSTTRRNFDFKRPTSAITTSSKAPATDKVEENNEQNNQQNETVVQRAKLVNHLKQPITTTEFAEPIDEPTTTSSTLPAITSTTTESILVTTEATSPQSSTMQYKEDTAASVPTYDPLNILKSQLAHAVRKLNTESQELQKLNQTESSDGIQIKTQISTTEDINLPIYHRRKYYQYYKDSPIVYVSPITVAPRTVPQTNFDIAKQIHDVFNVSNNRLVEPKVSEEETEALLDLEEAQKINSELGNFLVKLPGST